MFSERMLSSAAAREPPYRYAVAARVKKPLLMSSRAHRGCECKRLHAMMPNAAARKLPISLRCRTPIHERRCHLRSPTPFIACPAFLLRYRAGGTAHVAAVTTGASLLRLILYTVARREFMPADTPCRRDYAAARVSDATRARRRCYRFREIRRLSSAVFTKMPPPALHGLLLSADFAFHAELPPPTAATRCRCRRCAATSRRVVF